MDIWENCKKNMLLLRKRYGLTQKDIADSIGISRGCYQYCEQHSPTSLFDKISVFWLDNYGITPNELLLSNLDTIIVQEDIRITKLLSRIDELVSALDSIKNDIGNLKGK